MNTAAVIGGALIGGGVAAAVLAVLPRRRDLAADLAALTATARADTRAEAAPDAPGRRDRRLLVRIGRPAVPLLARLGLPRADLRRDLALLGRSVSDHLAEQAVVAAVGLAVVPLLAAMMGAASPLILLAFAATGGAAGFLLVQRQTRHAAATRRAQMRATLSSYLDLVVLAVDGGAGIDQALTDAAANCAGWPGARLAGALRTAHLTRSSCWEALARLGADTGITELTDLSATAQLAGTEGARVRESLSARAESLRTRLLAETEAAANRATEKLSLPMLLLAAGFLLLLTYPALAGLMATP
jgi:Flp pilus assembly protein TadB